MRRLLSTGALPTALVLVPALVLTAPCLAAPDPAGPSDAAAPIAGTWLTAEGEALVRIDRCDGALCGRLIRLRDRDDDGSPLCDTRNPDPALRDRPLEGLRILTGLSATPDDNGVYRDGRIYDPDSGRTYRCNVELLPDGRLKFRGFVGFSLLGRTTYWTRVD